MGQKQRKNFPQKGTIKDVIPGPLSCSCPPTPQRAACPEEKPSGPSTPALAVTTDRPVGREGALQ